MLRLRSLPICLRIIALVRDNGAGINIGTEVEEHFEVAAVARCARSLKEASASKKVSNTPLRLKRQKRFP